MFGPGQEAISHEIVAKYHILRQTSYFGPIFEVKLRVLSTLAANSVQTTTLQSTLMPYKSIEYAQVGSGSNILRDNAGKPVFAVLGRFWRNFEMKCAFSRPTAKVHVEWPDDNSTIYQTKSLEWLNPGLKGSSHKITPENLILRQWAEIGAF